MSAVTSLDPTLVERLGSAVAPKVRFALFDQSGRRLAGTLDASVAPADHVLSAAARSVQDGAYTTHGLWLDGMLRGALVVAGQAEDSRRLREALSVLLAQTAHVASELELQRESNLIYHLGETIGASMDADAIPALLLAEAVRLTRAEGGLVLLVPSTDPGSPPQPAGQRGSPQLIATLDAAAGGGNPPAPVTTSRDGSTSVLVVAIRKLGKMILGRSAARPFTEREAQLVAVLASGVGLEKARYLQREVQRQRLESEVALGSRIQLSLLPRSLPDVPGWELHTVYRAAREVGGDFFDVLGPETCRGRLIVSIGDVAGKGVPAALMMAYTRALLRSGSGSDPSPARVLDRVNELILDDGRAGLLVTAQQASVDVARGIVRLASAGHEPALVLRGRTGRVQSFPGAGTLLGVSRAPTIAERRIRLAEGDALVLYSDGVTDARDARRRFFGERRLRAVLRASAGGSAREVAERLTSAVERFVANADPYDDLTLVVLRRADRAGAASASDIASRR